MFMVIIVYINKLQELCEKENISFTDLSKYVGIDRSTLGKYMNGYLTIPLRHLNRICNFLEISLDYALCLTELVSYYNSKREINQEAFSQRIKKFRIQNNLTQVELSKMLKCSHSAISEYENNKRLISTSHLYSICRRYHVSADYLLGKIDS